MTKSPSVWSVAPLYLAGFTTAFGAHGVAGVLGTQSEDIGLSLLGLGLMLALYDVAEVILKPLFGALSDRIGVRPVILGGLVAFGAASLLAATAPTPFVLGLARFGQGAAAAAFSPASSAAVARLAGKERLGRSFGRYGAWKSLGYVLGPLCGVALAQLWGIQALYLVLAVLAVAAAAWVLCALPRLPVMPRTRYTVADLVRQSTERGFLVPTLLLATTTGILGVAVGFLPLLAVRLDLHPLAGAFAVTLLALVSALVQPVVGGLRDRRRITTRDGGAIALGLAAVALLVLALVPHGITLYASAAVIGLMVGTVTPLCFAHLAEVTPEERLGRTMGNAELGREVGDAGGPLLVGAIAGATTLPVAFLALAAAGLGAGALARGALRDDAERTPRPSPG
ncbi:MFS transporter [Nocardiopsis sp. MG754419]|uniref:MFS transporter n=1 Tax=Nocardiopsis sp. MG754419 TaxID=2259865 RepID=UPI001BA9F93C|nr:MFS transporter [Nocardiopsis sp. MG754419]MBR8742056.1 MFS transporter [Nocardiopsis sp. MG754419]